MEQPEPQLLIVTGLSGSGKSVALNALEDVGYYCVDNLPAPLLSAFTAEILQNPQRDCTLAAVGMDVRGGETDLQPVVDIIRNIRAQGINCEILFLEASKDVLMRRYSETRRRHPLSSQGTSLLDALEKEKGIMHSMHKIADAHFDTSTTSPYELRDFIRQHIGSKGKGEISLAIQSFGFKYGVPHNADFLFDTRCLKNPHWEEKLRPLTGLDSAVVEFLQNDHKTEALVEELQGFLKTWLRCFDSSDRSYITIAIGCTGGQHRSVYVAEQLGRHLQDPHFDISIKHRELGS